MDKIQIRRGLKKDLPTLAAGEMALTYDTKELHVGNSGGGIITFKSEPPATYICATQAELDAALAAMPKDGGKIILKSGYYSIRNDSNLSRLSGNGHLVLEGMGEATTLFLTGDYSKSVRGKITLKNMFIRSWFSSDGDIEVIDCQLADTDDPDEVSTRENIWMLRGENVSIRGGEITMNGAAAEVASKEFQIDCSQAIYATGTVLIDDCVIYMTGEKNNLTMQPQDGTFDLNLIYSAANGCISNSVIHCKNSNYDYGVRINIVNYGDVNMVGNHIMANSGSVSISHHNTETASTAAFVGNYVKCKSGMYMRFGTVSGNVFDVSSAATLHLLCPTNMQGNTFKGSGSVTVDCQQHKSIVANNLSDGTFSVTNNPTGGLSSNNVQY